MVELFIIMSFLGVPCYNCGKVVNKRSESCQHCGVKLS
jgi:rRNA maturation endonuclease Nob1